MTTQFRFIRDYKHDYIEDVTPSDTSTTLHLTNEAKYIDIPGTYAEYYALIHYISNKQDQPDSNQVFVEVRKYPYPPSDQKDKNIPFFMVPGGSRLYFYGARPEIDNDILIHASFYKAVDYGTVAYGSEAILLAINIVPEDVELPVGKTQQFIAYGYYSDEMFRDISDQVDWMVEDEEIATIVVDSGFLTAVSEGETEVGATLGSIISEPVNVTVEPAVIVSLDIIPKNPSATVGETVQFTATATYSNGTSSIITPTEWYSSDEIAIIDHNGLADAVAQGTAQIGCYVNTPLGDVIAPQTTLIVFNAVITDVPTGFVGMTLGEVAPYGWLMLNGEPVSSTQFSKLRTFLTQHNNIVMFGNAGTRANMAPNENHIVNIYNLNTYVSDPDELHGLSGFILAPFTGSSPKAVQVTCPAANSFDPSSGYILHYTTETDHYLIGGTNLKWYIVFIKDGIIQLHPDIPTDSHRIVYVNIQSAYTATQVANALILACNYMGFNLPCYMGTFPRFWDGGYAYPGFCGSSSDRVGRADSYNGNHVGTMQLDQLETHNHRLLNLGLNGTYVGFPGLIFTFAVSGASARYVDTAALNYSEISSTGGDETHPPNSFFSPIIKW